MQNLADFKNKISGKLDGLLRDGFRYKECVYKCAKLSNGGEGGGTCQRTKYDFFYYDLRYSNQI